MKRLNTESKIQTLNDLAFINGNYNAICDEKNESKKKMVLMLTLVLKWCIFACWFVKLKSEWKNEIAGKKHKHKRHLLSKTNGRADKEKTSFVEPEQREWELKKKKTVLMQTAWSWYVSNHCDIICKNVACEVTTQGGWAKWDVGI